MAGSSAPIQFIAVMGLTGTGKTTFINAMSGASLETSSGLKSCTKHIATAAMILGGHQVCLIDSPGFDDADMKDTEILKEIASGLDHMNRKNLQLTGLIYFHNISHVRFGKTALRNVRLFRALVGDKNMQNVVLVSTRWDIAQNDNQEVVNQRIAQLESEEDFWGGMIRAGARHEKLQNIKYDGMRILEGLLRKPTTEVQLQSQLRQSLSLSNTTAGQVLQEELKKIQDEHKKEISFLQTEIEESRRAGQVADADLMNKERQKVEKEQERLQQALIDLKNYEIGQRDHEIEMRNREIEMKNEEIRGLKKKLSNPCCLM
ncbi:P-loop containing nucleoside triphosphate hydrolase protein [Nemania sp. FL0916]|nr:P-loop containing nucleoside triphosphate hydrolase protein [Nemania sp. FL0916]